METYSSKQTSWFLWLIVVFGVAGIVSLQLADIPKDEMIRSSILIGAFSILIFLLFFKLESKVFEDRVEIKFGIGLIKKTIDLKSVEELHKVTNKFWYGWGIRFTPHGWLWNISGYEAVQFKIKGQQRGFRLGCRNHEEMYQAIKTQLDKL